MFPIVIAPATSSLGIPGSKVLCDDGVHAGSVVSSPLRPIVYSIGSLANNLGPNSIDFQAWGESWGALECVQLGAMV